MTTDLPRADLTGGPCDGITTEVDVFPFGPPGVIHFGPDAVYELAVDENGSPSRIDGDVYLYTHRGSA